MKIKEDEAATAVGRCWDICRGFGFRIFLQGFNKCEREGSSLCVVAGLLSLSALDTSAAERMFHMERKKIVNLARKGAEIGKAGI